jgi:hypothetical protein
MEWVLQLFYEFAWGQFWSMWLSLRRLLSILPEHALEMYRLFIRM